MMIGKRPVKGALGHVVQINICPKCDSKRLPTLAVQKPVPGYRHKMVLRSHLEYPKYLDVNIVTPSPQSDAILKHELSSGLLQKWQKQCAHKDPLPTLVTLFSCT